VLNRLERYELDVFAEQAETELQGGADESPQPESVADSQNGGAALGRAARRAKGRALSARATLFEAVNETLLDELREADLESLSPEEIRALLVNIRRRII